MKKKGADAYEDVFLGEYVDGELILTTYQQKSPSSIGRRHPAPEGDAVIAFKNHQETDGSWTGAVGLGRTFRSRPGQESLRSARVTSMSCFLESRMTVSLTLSLAEYWRT